MQISYCDPSFEFGFIFLKIIPPQTRFKVRDPFLGGNADPEMLNSIEEQCFTAIQCNAVYESVYLLGTSLARP